MNIWKPDRTIPRNETEQQFAQLKTCEKEGTQERLKIQNTI